MKASEFLSLLSHTHLKKITNNASRIGIGFAETRLCKFKCHSKDHQSAHTHVLSKGGA